MKQIDDLLKNMRKKYGEGSVMKIQSEGFPKIDRIPVDSPKIGEVLGNGGIPRGRVMEVFGDESSGKTSLACYLAGQVQKSELTHKDEKGNTFTRPGRVAFIDAEHAIDFEYAKTFGFDVEEALFSQPSSGEEALDIAKDFIESGLVDFVIIDSVPALTPQAELDGEMGDAQMASIARLMGKAMRKLVSALGSTKCSLMFVNQNRESIGGFSANPGMKPKVQPGGKALKFTASIRLETRRRESIIEKDQFAGLNVQIKSVKNKTAPPMRKHEVTIYIGKGFDTDSEWIDFAIANDIVERSGSWFSTPTGDRFQGKNALIEFLHSNEDIYQDIIEKTKKAIFDPKVENTSEEENIDIAEFEDIEE